MHSRLGRLYIWAIIVCLNFLSMTIYATAIESWFLGEKEYRFFRDPQNNALLSIDCIDKKCDAKNELAKITFKGLKSEAFAGGKNPGAVLCHQSVNKGNVVFLRDKNGNDNSFCVFADKSMTSSSTLTIFARKNDENKK